MKDIERLAREAGLVRQQYGSDGLWLAGTTDLARFAALVRADALEQAAQACRDIATDCDDWDEGGLDGRVAAGQCHDAIRALKDAP